MSATDELRKLLDGLRSVGNLHEFAELFGFNWEDDSDWTWHDVAVKMADELEQAIAATLGNSRAERTCKFDYEQAAEYWQRMYEQTFAERTCRDTGENEWHFVCSACGYEQNGYECWNYCPSCGCKAVG